MTDILQDKFIKARKSHRCDCCGKNIEKGETYHYQVNVDSGDIKTFKSHKLCNDILNLAYVDNYHEDGEGVTEEDFNSFVRDMKFECRDMCGITITDLQKVLEYALSRG